MTKPEHHILLHTLGLTYKPRHNRNYFAAEPGTDDYRLCESLAKQGLMKRGTSTSGGLIYFYATDEGEQAVVAKRLREEM